MPIFFMEYEKMHCQLYKEDVPEFTRKYSEFFYYAIEQLKIDLEALVAWKILYLFRILELLIPLKNIKINIILI